MVFKLGPNLSNLVSSITERLGSHSNNFMVYSNNVKNKYPDKEYKLVVFIEDISSPCSIVNENEQCIHPLEIDEIVRAILGHENDVYAIIYCVGNGNSKQLTVAKLETLNEKLRNGNIKEMDRCRLQICKSVQTVGTVQENDSSLAEGVFRDKLNKAKDTVSIKPLHRG